MCKKNCVLSNAVAVQPLLVRWTTPFTFSHFTRAPSQTLTIHKKVLAQKGGGGTKFHFLKKPIGPYKPRCKCFLDNIGTNTG